MFYKVSLTESFTHFMQMSRVYSIGWVVAIRMLPIICIWLRLRHWKLLNWHTKHFQQCVFLSGRACSRSPICSDWKCPRFSIPPVQYIADPIYHQSNIPPILPPINYIANLISHWSNIPRFTTTCSVWKSGPVWSLAYFWKDRDQDQSGPVLVLTGLYWFKIGLLDIFALVESFE